MGDRLPWKQQWWNGAAHLTNDAHRSKCGAIKHGPWFHPFDGAKKCKRCLRTVR